MAVIASLLGGLGVGSTEGQLGFSDAEKLFIKTKFKYGLLLKQKLASGEINQAYYDSNQWLLSEDLSPPYQGWWDEFKQAINSEDLNWLAKQVGESVDDLTRFMGSALETVASKATGLAGTLLSSTTGGLFKGFFGSLNLWGWLAVAAIGAGVYYGFKTGAIQRAFKTGAKVAVL